MEQTTQQTGHFGRWDKGWTKEEDQRLKSEITDLLCFEAIARNHGVTVDYVEDRAGRLAVDELLNLCGPVEVPLAMSYTAEKYRVSELKMRRVLLGMKPIDILTMLKILPKDFAEPCPITKPAVPLSSESVDRCTRAFEPTEHQKRICVLEAKVHALQENNHPCVYSPTVNDCQERIAGLEARVDSVQRPIHQLSEHQVRICVLESEVRALQMVQHPIEYQDRICVLEAKVYELVGSIQRLNSYVELLSDNIPLSNQPITQGNQRIQVVTRSVPRRDVETHYIKTECPGVYRMEREPVTALRNGQEAAQAVTRNAPPRRYSELRLGEMERDAISRVENKVERETLSGFSGGTPNTMSRFLREHSGNVHK